MPGNCCAKAVAREIARARNPKVLSLEYRHDPGDIFAMKTIVFTHSAVKDLDALADDARESVLSALSRYAVSGKGDIKRLSGRESFRLRTGRYRVIFDEDAQTILAIYIGKRETKTYLRH
jgi:mRNA interferase RelE/StbE